MTEDNDNIPVEDEAALEEYVANATRLMMAISMKAYDLGRESAFKEIGKEISKQVEERGL